MWPSGRGLPGPHRQGRVRRRPDDPHPGVGRRQPAGVSRSAQGRPDAGHGPARNGPRARPVRVRLAPGIVRHDRTVRLSLWRSRIAGSQEPRAVHPARGGSPGADGTRPARIPARRPSATAIHTDRRPRPPGSRCAEPGRGRRGRVCGVEPNAGAAGDASAVGGRTAPAGLCDLQLVARFRALGPGRRTELPGTGVVLACGPRAHGSARAAEETDRPLRRGTTRDAGGARASRLGTVGGARVAASRYAGSVAGRTDHSQPERHQLSG